MYHNAHKLLLDLVIMSHKFVYLNALYIVELLVTYLPEFVFCNALLMVCMQTPILDYVLQHKIVQMEHMVLTHKEFVYRFVQQIEIITLIYQIKFVLHFVLQIIIQTQVLELVFKPAQQCHHYMENYQIKDV